MSNILKYNNNEGIYFKKCSKCKKHYRWICVYCFCKSKFNIKILNKIFCFDLKDIDTYLYHYLNNYDQDNATINPENLTGKKLFHNYRQTLKIKQNLSLVQNNLIYNLEKDLVTDIVQNSYKLDYVGNTMMKEVITKFFKQQHYNMVFKKMRSIVCYHDYLENGILYYKRIYQVYMVQTSDSDNTIESVKEAQNSNEDNDIHKKKNLLQRKFFKPFKIIGKCSKNKKKIKKSSVTSLTSNKKKKISNAISKENMSFDTRTSSEKIIDEIDTENISLSSNSPRIKKVVIVPTPFIQNISVEELYPSDSEKDVKPSTSAEVEKQENVHVKVSEIEEEKFSVIYNSTTPHNVNQIIKINQLRTIEMQEIRNLLHSFRESELNLKRMLAKYIQDKTKEEELFQAIFKHGKTYSEAERHAYNLAAKMWEEKSNESIQLEKSQKDTIETLTKQNRKLHEQIEHLKSKQENLSFSRIEHRQASLPNIKLKRNNDILRSKISSMTRQIECLETQLQTSKYNAEYLQMELTRAVSQTEKQKELLRKSNTDHELEETSLLNQLSTNEKVIKECVEAGDILMDDLDSLQRQMKKFPVSLNLTKLKCQGSSLAELINLSRLWANEVTRELLNTYAQKELLEKDNKYSSNEISRLKEELQGITTENTQLKEKLEKSTTELLEHKQLAEKVPAYEDNINKYSKELEDKENMLKEERSYAIVASENINELTKTITNKEITINHLQKVLQDMKNENTLLRNQLDHNKKFMDKSYISSVMKQLTDAQDKIMYYQTHFSEYDAAKSNFMEQSKQFNDERAKLMQNQQLLYEQLQEKQFEITKLSTENVDIKGKLLKQQNMLLMKGNEFQKHMNQNKTIQNMYTKLSSEFLRNQQLEANTLSMNFEANRLAVAAEHNSYISNQLQDIIKTKNETITNLQNNIDKLNSQQQHNMDDKMAMTQKITELQCSIKQLKDDLENEKQRVMNLTKTKDEIEKIMEYKLQEMQQMLNEDRKELDNLMNDHQNIINRNDNLTLQIEQQKTQIESHRTSEIKLQILYEQAESKYVKLENKCHDLENNLQNTQRSFDIREVKHRNEITERENRIKHNECHIKKLNEEIEELNNSINFLQCTSNKLKNELDELRQTEINYKEEKSKMNESILQLERELEGKSMNLQSVLAENNSLNTKLKDHEDMIKKKNDECESHTNKMKEIEDLLKQEIEKHDKNNRKLVEHMQLLVNASKKRQQILDETNLKCAGLESELQNKDKSVKEISEKLMDANKKEKIIQDLETELNECKIKINELSNINKNYLQKINENQHKINVYKKQLIQSTFAREKELVLCKNILNEISSEFNSKMKDNENELNLLCKQFKDFECNHRCRAEISQLQQKVVELTTSYENTLKCLTDEKIQKKCLEENCINLSENLAKAKSEIAKARNYIEDLSEKIEHISFKTSKILNIKKALQDELKYQVEHVQEQQKYIEDLEKQLLISREKLKETNSNNVDKYLEKSFQEDVLRNTLTSLEKSEGRNKLLKEQLLEVHEKMMELKNECSILFHRIQQLEFDNSELVVKIHELETKSALEKNVIHELKLSNERLLAAIWRVKLYDAASQSAKD